MTWEQKVQAAGVLVLVCAALAFAASATFGAAPQAIGAVAGLVAAVKATAVVSGLVAYATRRLAPRPEEA